ncbi:hypothetical protein Pint_04240 [Pistacia integerrima]|uniref:Uncharacterized protein n=1 Tax=Pistacia integerrima TaxID=434235 RepID=A0ACC0Z4I4_9ROSI|nr:hypothetical protein Pint_04240 [Pistacia integerrima]
MVSKPSIANALVDPMASVAESSSSSAAFHLPSQVISIKLDGTNFLAWSAQLLPLFRSYGLMGIVDGSEPSPPQFFSAENKTQVISTIYGLETSRLAWQALGHDFLDEVKSLADGLSTVGKPIDDSDLILSVLNGLNSSFHSFVTTYMLLAKEKSMPFSDFHVELLNYNLMQKFHSQTIQLEAGPYALYSYKPGSKPGSRNSNSRSRFSSVSKGSGGSSSHFRQPLPHLPSSSPIPTAAQSVSRSRSLCQICKREGHQALDCFNRMNYSFQGRHPPTDLSVMVAEANTTYLNQNQWYADSGANIHVTFDIANLATSQPYDGDDSVGVGNGTGLVISRTGTTSIQTSSSTLKLNNVAYCPQTSAHLLSINKFCKDNNVLFELIGSCFFVKDILAGDTILTGPSDNGLCPINLRQLSSPKFHALTMTSLFLAGDQYLFPKSARFPESARCMDSFPARDQSLFSAPTRCVASLLACDQPLDSTRCMDSFPARDQSLFPTPVRCVASLPARCVASLPAHDQPPDSARCVTSSPTRVQSIFTDSARCMDPQDTHVISSSQPETHLDSSFSPPSSPSLAPISDWPF